MAHKRPLIAGNWKMNLNHLEANHLVTSLGTALKDLKFDSDVDVVVFPPFTDIRTVQTIVDADKLPIAYGAQDISIHDNGAFTGEVSASMLTRLGCSYVIVGHSERREYHGETNALIAQKATQAMKNSLTPIICCGESLEVRQSGGHCEFVVGQIREVLSSMDQSMIDNVVIAYEPIWAIGTGEVATADDAQEVCGAIRLYLEENFGVDKAQDVRLLYGGSVKKDNVSNIMMQKDIDGVLVGGASLKAVDFAHIALYKNMA
ncbi:MAG: triose-phosphate isomerase [Actinomycetaceae bacterium]|nr:triose-phosphate isomerase [Actinomycetaceae bacterium]